MKKRLFSFALSVLVLWPLVALANTENAAPVDWVKYGFGVALALLGAWNARQLVKQKTLLEKEIKDTESNEKKQQADAEAGAIQQISFQAKLMEYIESQDRKIAQQDLKHEQLVAEHHELIERFSAIKESVLLFKMFGVQAQVLMWTKDEKGRRLMHNKFYQKVTGHDIRECFGKTDLEITKDPRLAASWAKKDRRVMRRRESVMEIEPCAHKETPDNVFDVLSMVSPRLVRNEISGKVECKGTEGIAIVVEDIINTFEKFKVQWPRKSRT